ncbi:hypothetical protein AURDEDRAFT_52079, partial [Auricularia subglabra TFB-10046 SS5]
MSSDHKRKLVIGIVNSFTSKSEIGAPMAASYLLDLPDHYKSHKFKTIYWRVSPIQDYMFRPIEHSGYCLYDWIRLYSKSKTKQKVKKQVVQVVDGTDISKMVNLKQGEGVQDSRRYHFTEGHSQVDTHTVFLDNSLANMVPNFIGGSLPRRDAGDRDFYCCTMLTFFKPWRTGHDLKSADDSWEHVFEQHSFSERQTQIMNNFNLKYECLDERDNFSKQRRSGALIGENTESDEIDSNF